MSVAELGVARDPRLLVPGDQGAVVRAMWSLREMGDSLTTAGRNLARVNVDTAWRGEAADAFRARYAEEPGRWMAAGGSFAQAASALDRYANALGSSQRLAQSAVRVWDEGDVLTAPEVREQYRRRAGQMLAEARDDLRAAGETAARAVAAACERAPKGPGVWSRVGKAVGKAGDVVVDTGAETANALTSFGNAVLHHPGDLATGLAGASLIAASSGGEAAGLALDATGVGAVGGVPLNVVAGAGLVTGAGLTTAATGNLIYHATSDQRVSPWERRPEGATAPTRGSNETNRLKEQVDQPTLDAARRELNGEVVARKSTGTPYDHVHKVRDAQNGLMNRIAYLKSRLGDTRTAASDRPAFKAELSEASRLLDRSERFVPRPRPAPDNH